MGCNRVVGDAGEDAVSAWYQARGFDVVDRNWRVREGEIDVIARRGSTIVFCEVKTRRGDAYGSPAEAVTARKQARLRTLATLWLRTQRSRSRWCASTSRRSGPTAAGHGSSTCSKQPSSAPTVSALTGARPGRDARLQQPLCQCRRSSGAPRGTTTSCPSPGRISWSQPGQRYAFSAWYGCTCRTSTPSSVSVQRCSPRIVTQPR